MRRAIAVLASAVLLISCACAPAVAADGDGHKSVLIVHSFNDDVHWQRLIWKGLGGELGHEDGSIRVHREHLDAWRFPDLVKSEAFSRYLEEKYADIDLDLIVFDSIPASVYAGANPGLFAGVDRFHLNGSPDVLNADPTQSAIESLVIRSDLERSFQEMLAIAEPKRIVVVGDHLRSPSRAHYVDTIRRFSPSLPPDITVDIILDKTEQELAGVLSDLPEDSAIFFLPVGDESRGGRPVEDYFGDLSEAANAPAFSHWTPLFGSGLVGGYMISPEHIGRIAARRIRDGLFGDETDTSDVADTSDASNGYVHWYDDRAMQRFGIGANRLPPESEVFFRPTSVLETYRREIVYAVAIGGICVLLGVGWIVALRREVTQRTLELNAQRQRAEVIARTDPLTELNNRRAFYELSEAIAAEASRETPYSVIAIDIDHFKSINDTFGHDEGDKTLRKVAARIRQTARENDVTGRLGGEEFSVVAPSTLPANARRMAERLKAEISDVLLPDSTTVKVSIGVATGGAGSDNLDDVIRRADAALYRAKNTGRNRIVCADCPEERAAAGSELDAAGIVRSLATS